MTVFTSRLHSFLRSSANLRAMEEEVAVLDAERTRANSLHDQLARQFQCRGNDAVTLGHAVDGGWPVQIAREQLAGHMGFWGPSGSGKSFLLALLLRHLLHSGVRRFVVADPKSETVELAKRAIVEFSHTLPPSEAESLLSRVIVLDLFAASTLPRLQVLAPEEGVDAEMQAYEIAGIITNELDNGGVGVRQEAILHKVIEALIRAGLPLTVLPTALETPELLDALAENHGPPDFFRAVAARLRKESRDRILGLVSRADRLLRLRCVRLALGGSPDCIDFAELLDDRIVLINLAPPQGSTDIGRFMAGLVWVQINHAIRRRPNGSAPTFVCVDEWPTFLAAGGPHLADTFEDLLRLARSKGVFLAVLSQDMTSVAKVSRSIADVVKNNLHLHFIFRAMDSNAWDFALPVTGTRPRPRGAPWEEQRLGYLERGAELTLLRDGLERLADRHCYIVDRRTGLPGVLMKTADLVLKASPSEVRSIEERAAKSDAVATIAELERGEREVHRRIEGLLSSSSNSGSDDRTAPRPPRRGRRPMDIG
jgi:Helicase HerA, central domain